MGEAMKDSTTKILLQIVTLVMAAALIMLICGGAFGQQCGPGGCGPGGCGVSASVQWQQQIQQPQYRQPVRSTPNNDLWRECMPTITYTRKTIVGTVQQSIVSGVLIYNYPDKDVSLVITTSHLFSSGLDGDIVVRFPKSGHRGSLVAFSAEHDVAVIAISRATSKAIFLTRSPVQQGEQIRMMTVSPLRQKSGRIVGETTDGFIVDTPVIPGWSGGPVVNMQGHLLGIISGAENRTYVTGAEGIRAVLCPYMSGATQPPPTNTITPTAPPVVPGDPWTEMPDIPVPPTTTVPPTGPTDPQPHNAYLEILARLEVIEARIDSIQLTPGPEGKRGPQGPPGNNGQNAPPVDLSGIKARLDALEQREPGVTVEQVQEIVDVAIDTHEWRPSVDQLPPLRIQTLKPDGTVHQDVTAHLGDLVKIKPLIVSGDK